MIFVSTVKLCDCGCYPLPKARLQRFTSQFVGPLVIFIARSQPASLCSLGVVNREISLAGSIFKAKLQFERVRYRGRQL